jgi:hypothetical protein
MINDTTYLGEGLLNLGDGCHFWCWGQVRWWKKSLKVDKKLKAAHRWVKRQKIQKNLSSLSRKSVIDETTDRQEFSQPHGIIVKHLSKPHLRDGSKQAHGVSLRLTMSLLATRLEIVWGRICSRWRLPKDLRDRFPTFLFRRWRTRNLNPNRDRPGMVLLITMDFAMNWISLVAPRHFSLEQLSLSERQSLRRHRDP